MSDNSKIEWTDATWNPITGCSVVSAGCKHCYAMKLAGTRLRNHPSRNGLTVDTKAGPVWNGKVRFNAEWLDQPLRWKRTRKIFVCAHGDLFHESVPDEWIDRVLGIAILAPQHTFQILTKRAARMRDYFKAISGNKDRAWKFREVSGSALSADALQEPNPAHGATMRARRGGVMFDNVWLGVSIEDQDAADERIPPLLQTPAAVRFLSCEPLLGPVDLQRAVPQFEYLRTSYVDGNGDRQIDPPSINWIIAGGESGQNARPMHPDWVRSLRDQCAMGALAYGPVPFFFKQWGEHLPGGTDFDGKHHTWEPDFEHCADGTPPEYNRVFVVNAHGVDFGLIGKRRAGRTLDGVEHDAMPEAAQ